MLKLILLGIAVFLIGLFGTVFTGFFIKNEFNGIDCSQNFTDNCGELEKRLINYNESLFMRDEILINLAQNFSNNSLDDIDIINNISKNVNNLIFDFYDKGEEIEGLLLNGLKFGLIKDSNKFYFRLVKSQNELSGLGGDPLWIFNLKGGACQDKSVLTSALLNYQGIDARLISIPGHAWIEIKYNNSCIPIEASRGLGFNSSNDFTKTCKNDFPGRSCYKWIKQEIGFNLEKGC